MSTTTGTRTGSKKKAPSSPRTKGRSSVAKKSSSKKGSSVRASGSRSTGSGSKGSSKRSGPGLPIRILASIREHIGEQRDDVLGIALILLGVLMGLGTYAHQAGVIGSFFEAAVRGLFGVYGLLVPLLLVYFGGHVLLGRPSQERGRIGVGVLLLGIAVVGGWHLIQGTPDWQGAAGWKAVWPAGGLLGWAIATPLVAGLSMWGASAVFVALMILGLLIVTKTPFSAIVEAIRGGLRSAEHEVPAGAADAEAGVTDNGHRSRAKPTDETTRIDTSGADDEPVRRAVLQLEDSKADQPPLPSPIGQSSAATEAGDAAFTDGLTDADREAGRVPDPPLPADTARLTADGKRKAKKIKPVENWDDYELPPVELLSQGSKVGNQAQKHLDASADALQATLDEFGIDAKVARFSRGPTVTRFEIELGPGVQVRKVANLGDDIAYALAAPDVRIVAPIPGKSAIGVEVPNRDRDLITLRDILESDTARADPHPMLVSLGVDIAGNPAMVNLTTMPHLLVSGATGAGKSITLNSMIASIVTRARPDQVRMILVDPKRVELNHYEGAPHLLTPVVVDPRRATDALEWTVKEMEMRYDTLARLGYRDIDGYNDAVAAGQVRADTEEEREAYGHMPYILLVIDELSDLMMVAPRDVEDAICRIAQMARAVGIHMVIATQRPSVDVITGLIKANVPSRLALAVASQTDSRTILDMGGAEKLVGKGDMLFLPANQGKPSRLQGCFVSEGEIRSVVEYAKRQREAEFVEGVVKQGKSADEVDMSRGSDDDSDEAMVRRAAHLVVESGLGSTSMLQRKLRIGFARAGRVMDELEEMGVVGPNEGSKAREVLWTPEMVEEAVDTNLI